MRGGEGEDESGEFQWAVKESDDRGSLSPRRRPGRQIRARYSLLPLRSSHCGRISRAASAPLPPTPARLTPIPSLPLLARQR